MSEKVKCKNCGSIATLISRNGVMEIYLCDACGLQTEAIAHYLDKPIPLETKSYKAIVTTADQNEARKAAIKIRRIFSGYSNFYKEDLQNQLSAGLLIFELGIYSDREMVLLARQAEAINLNLQFILLPPADKRD